MGLGEGETVAALLEEADTLTFEIKSLRDLKVDAISSLNEPRNLAKGESASDFNNLAIHCLHNVLP